MKTALKILTVSVLLILSFHGFASALNLGINITIDDGTYAGADWYGNHEDNEVEPNCQVGQSWDMEGFFLNGTILTMVAGYDFINGEYGSGDIFIDVNGDAIFGSNAVNLDNLANNGNQSILNYYGYDYVLDMDFANGTYNIYQIDNNTQLLSVYYRQNDGSNAWQYNASSDPSSNIAFSYLTGLTDGDVGGLAGGTHNAVSVNLDFLTHGTTFTSHFTMGCGNDNLMGQATLAPEPATMALFGIGLICLAGIRNKLLKK